MDTTPPPPTTTVKEALDILDANMANEKAIRIFERPLIPMDLVDSTTNMDSYLPHGIGGRSSRYRIFG